MSLLRLSLGVLLMLCGVAPLSRAFATTPAELFQGGNSAYEQGKFQEAAEAYERVLGYGVADPRVLYNLANAYFKLGKLGPAILNYERALRLDPSDQDARDNLELARGQIRDRVEEAEIPYPIKVVQDSLDIVPVDALSAVFLCLYAIACGLAGCLPFTTGGGRRRLLGYSAAAVGVLALVAGGALVETIQTRTAARGIVMTDRVDVLSGPSAENTVLFTVHEGTRLELRNRRDGWLQVSLPNAMSGWIPAGMVERV
jgi:tetratricopeptide repeat protein/SH3 domain-containing protein